jgi:hypothetical protein
LSEKGELIISGPERGERQETGGNYVMRSFMICVLRQIYFQ